MTPNDAFFKEGQTTKLSIFKVCATHDLVAQYACALGSVSCKATPELPRLLDVHHEDVDRIYRGPAVGPCDAMGR